MQVFQTESGSNFKTQKPIIPTKAKLDLYKTSVLPQLTYCHTVWHFCKASDRRKLERVQERALRAIFNTKAHSYEELLNRANLSILYNRRHSNSNVQGEKQYKSSLYQQNFRNS